MLGEYYYPPFSPFLLLQGSREDNWVVNMNTLMISNETDFGVGAGKKKKAPIKKKKRWASMSL